MKKFLAAALLALLLIVAAPAQEHAPAEHGSTEAAHGDSLSIWKWVNFAILASILGWGIAKSAPGFFRSRTEEIQRGIADASRIRQEAEARAAKMEARMAALGSEIDQLRSDARAEMAHESERIRKETEAHIARIQSHGEQEIQALTKHAEQSLRAYSAQLALELAEQRIRNRMTPESQNTLVNGFIRQLDSHRPEVRQ